MIIFRGWDEGPKIVGLSLRERGLPLAEREAYDPAGRER
jgi:hypothetical protein